MQRSCWPSSYLHSLPVNIKTVAWSPVAIPSNHYFHCLVWWLNYSADGFERVAEERERKEERVLGGKAREADIRQQKDISYSDTTKRSHLTGRGILVVSTTLVQMSHAEAFVSQWGGEAPFLFIYLKYWGLNSEVLVCIWAQRESEFGKSVSRRFLRSIFPHIQHILHLFHKHSMQKEHLEYSVSYCSKLLISFISMKWVEHCRAWLNILMKTWRDGLSILHLYNLFTYPSSN